jgi:hypothetical protein
VLKQCERTNDEGERTKENERRILQDLQDQSQPAIINIANAPTEAVVRPVNSPPPAPSDSLLIRRPAALLDFVVGEVVLRALVAAEDEEEEANLLLA